MADTTRWALYQIQGAIADGNYNSAPMDVAYSQAFMNYIRFFDANGAQVTPSAGNVTCLGSPDGVNFENFANATFAANTAYSPTKTKPTAQGTMRLARINLSGVTGAVSFIAEIGRY